MGVVKREGGLTLGRRAGAVDGGMAIVWRGWLTHRTQFPREIFEAKTNTIRRARSGRYRRFRARPFAERDGSINANDEL